MAQSQEEIDALLAEVNALADEAVSEILADGPDASPPPSDPTPGPPVPGDAQTAAAASPPSPPENLPPGRSEDLDRILRLQVPIIVQLARRTMPLSEILDLTTGSIIEFDKPADSELDLMINNKCIGRGQAVKVSENFGLRITRMGSLRHRIKAMGGS